MQAAEVGIDQIVQRALARGFVTAPGLGLHVTHEPRRVVPWEILGGHLLDEGQTRRRATFESWEVALGAADRSGGGEPLVAILCDATQSACFIVRYLRVRGWEAYEAEPNVILSRQVEKLARELVGTLRWTEGTTEQEPLERLRRLLFRALVGTRLPVTSWESPLPAFQLGRCAYFPQAQAAQEQEDVAASRCASRDSLPGAVVSSPALLRQFVDRDAPATIQAKAIEFLLRSSAIDVAGLAAILAQRHCGDPCRLLPLFRALFNDLALTPYTSCGDRLVALLAQLAGEDDVGPAVVADSLGYMLRHLARHLAAFDLRTFHNRGANYPDLLLLDGLLKAYLDLIERHSSLFADEPAEHASVLADKRVRRRALRQAWLVRKQHEGLKVPQAPTSLGDLQRVLPEDVPGVTEVEVLDPAKRRKRLFADDPSEDYLRPGVRALLEASLADLAAPAELRELGMATFLDRPLGVAKRPGEVDRTPLLTYEAFSASIARQRLTAWRGLGMLTEARRQELDAHLRKPAPQGFRGHQGNLPARPGVPCLEDANLAAPDFAFLRTTRSSLREFLAGFDWTRVREHLASEHDWLIAGSDMLLVRVMTPSDAMSSAKNAANEPLLVAMDGAGVARFHLCLPMPVAAVRYIEEVGVERIEGGLTLRPASGEAPPIPVPLAKN